MQIDQPWYHHNLLCEKNKYWFKVNRASALFDFKKTDQVRIFFILLDVYQLLGDKRISLRLVDSIIKIADTLSRSQFGNAIRQN